MANKKKILVVRKMSANEFYYNGNHPSAVIRESEIEHNESISRIATILKDAETEFRVVTRKDLSQMLVEEYDYVISAGGDGTVIATSFYNRKNPQLNLRTDRRSVGALCTKDLEAGLKKFLTGDYQIENWTRQAVYLNQQLVGMASNDTCIGEKLQFSKLARYRLTFLDTDAERIEDQSNSGLIICTGTGSTAWPSAFKPYSRTSRTFRFKTLLPHSGKINEGESHKIKIEYKGHEGKFAIDTMEYELPRDSMLDIVVGDPLKVIIPNSGEK